MEDSTNHSNTAVLRNGRVVAPDSYKLFLDEGNTIRLNVWNTQSLLAWQLVVNGLPSPITQHYTGILVHNGYGYATAYWDGSGLPIEVPFRIMPITTEVKRQPLTRGG